MTAQQLRDRILQINLPCVLNVEQPHGMHYLVVKLWRIRGALQGDKDLVISLIADPSNSNGDLFLYAPKMDECEAFAKAMTIYLDANSRCMFGGHAWDPSDNEVSFRYAMPYPPDQDSFPDVATLRRIFQNAYRCLTYLEVRCLLTDIANSPLISPELKNESIARLDETMKRMTGLSDSPDNPDDAV